MLRVLNIEIERKTIPKPASVRQKERARREKKWNWPLNATQKIEIWYYAFSINSTTSSDKRERTFMPDASLKQYATDQGKVAVSENKNEQTKEEFISKE